MTAVRIEDVPEDVLDALERRAARHGHSLQQELQQILGALAREESPARSFQPISLKMAEACQDSSWRREEIYGDDGR